MSLRQYVNKSVAGIFLALLGMSLSLSMSKGNAFAHDDKYFDSIKSPNGGQTRMAGVYHFELVLVQDSKTAKENSVTVFVTDHAGKALSTKGASASLTLVQGANKLTVNLQAEGENRLVGKASYASTANLKAALTVTMAGKPAEQARFTPFAIAKKSSAKAASSAKPEPEHQHEH
ncbi:hypothetical protein [Undibacterium flavidum]|uniref:Uncharacterized protein n=1 Tax=Undibacterium flavidum TaxID=2762297 RepID=A0ABR6Y8E6_9BURK|nr:hypothetical protein [Undibacterium flavidum]MBC3872881.1 hypothetical protein [Undibacterium flavidum]